MSGSRLARLRGVRAVELRVAMQRLAAARRDAAQLAGVQARVERLIGDLPQRPDPAIAATRAALVAVRRRLADRDVATATTTHDAACSVGRLQRRVEVVDSAIAAARGSAPC